MSTPGSASALPLHGHVKLLPSTRNAFSFVLDPNADTLSSVPLLGDVGDTPGAILMKSNRLNRRTGIVRRYSGPNRVSKPLLRASSRDPALSTTTAALNGASPSTTLRSIVCPTPMAMSASRQSANPGTATSRRYGPGRQRLESKLPLGVAGHLRLSADQRGGAEANPRVR